MKTLTNKQRTIIILPIFTIVLLIAVMLAVNIGYTPLSVSDIVRTVFGMGSEKETFIIYELRIPRSVVAIFCGVCLAASGAVMQGVTRNPLGTFRTSWYHYINIRCTISALSFICSRQIINKVIIFYYKN